MQIARESTRWQTARMPGILRYQYRSLRRTLGLALLILLAAQVLSLAFPLLTGNPYPYAGVYADFGVAMVVALIVSHQTAFGGTRFLLRFGTSRRAVWLGNVLSLCVGMAAFLLGTLLVSLLVGGLVVGLSGLMPQAFRVEALSPNVGAAALLDRSLTSTLGSLPASLLYTAEWTCLFYLLACCLRRNRAATLFVIVGVPMLLMILTLIPAVRQAFDVMESGTDSQRMLLGVLWMKRLTDLMHFVEKEWPLIQFLAAMVSLPLSYLCMRDTAQP